MSKAQCKNYWSVCGHIFFCEGKGYALTNTLYPICLGNEDDIKKFLDTGELNNGLNPTQRKVLISILEYRQEEGIGVPAGRPRERGVEIANRDRVIENAETSSNREPVDAIRKMAAKLQTEEGKEIYHQRKKIVEPVF